MTALLITPINLLAEQKTTTTNKKPLIVYFSRIGNTEQVAKQIHNYTGGDILPIQATSPYPQDYGLAVARAKQEKATKTLPPIQPTDINIQNYDTIFIGYPIWWSSIPAPIKTFLSTHDLSGKTIIPFCTHAGSHQAQSVIDMATLIPNAIFLEALVIEGAKAKSSETEIKT